MRAGIMVNSSQGNTAFGAYISLTGRMNQAVDMVPAEKVGSARSLTRSPRGRVLEKAKPTPYFIFAIVPTAVSIVPTTVYEPPKPTS